MGKEWQDKQQEKEPQTEPQGEGSTDCGSVWDSSEPGERLEEDQEAGKLTVARDFFEQALSRVP